MSDSIKVVIETNGDKISSVWTSASYSRTAILDWESVDIVHAKYLLADFSDALSTGAKRKLEDIVADKEREKDLKAIDRIVGGRTFIATIPVIRKLVEYCKSNPLVSISDAIDKVMNGKDKL